MGSIQLPDTSTVATVDLARLLAQDGAEVEKLTQAMEGPGYFYLDFRNDPSTQKVVDQARVIYAASDSYFEQPAETKAKDARVGLPDWSDRGYKSCETDESFEMSTDEINDGTLKLPAALDREAQTVNSFQTQCHEATQVVLSRLAEAVDLPLLTRHHQGDKTSESGLKLIAEPSVALVSNVLENKHRDSGTLTLLFYDTWSIHICLSKDDEEAEDWTFVPPPPEGCALVHGANSLARLSGGRLKSPLHRVTQPSDGAAKRYFLSYFLRPEHRLREEWEATDAATVAVA